MANTQNAGNDKKNQGQGNQSGNQEQTRRDDQGRQGDQTGSQGNQKVGNQAGNSEQTDLSRQKESDRGGQKGTEERSSSTSGGSDKSGPGQEDPNRSRK